MFDLCIVGAGLVGSAAARHGSSLTGVRVCIVGPQEPKVIVRCHPDGNYRIHRDVITGREVFGGHYDEGRITRLAAPDKVWAILVKKSMDRYRKLEKESGVSFYEEVGCLTIGKKDSEVIKGAGKTVIDRCLKAEEMNPSTLKNKFPFLEFSEDDYAIYEDINAGHISPRKLVKAQLIIANRQGCDIFRGTVSDVTRVSGPSGCHMVIKTENDRTISARKVLIATGAFTAFKNLLGPDCVPDITLRPLTVAKVEISDKDAAKLVNLRMPTIGYLGEGSRNWWQDFPRTPCNNYGWYMLPPVKYPDGKTYLKLGQTQLSVSKSLTTLSEVQQWFCQSGNSKLVTDTVKLMESIIPGLRMLSFHGDYCAIQQTPTRRPYIDKIHSQLGVSIGGNGHAAKSCDEIGRISVMMMLKDEWDSDIPPETFKLKLKQTHSKL